MSKQQWKIKWENPQGTMREATVDMDTFTATLELPDKSVKVQPGDVFRIDGDLYLTILCLDSKMRLFTFSPYSKGIHNRWNDNGVHLDGTIGDLIKSLGELWETLSYHGAFETTYSAYPLIWLYYRGDKQQRECPNE